jgi:hypothetical protein
MVLTGAVPPWHGPFLLGYEARTDEPKEAPPDLRGRCGSQQFGQRMDLVGLALLPDCAKLSFGNGATRQG